MTDPNKYAYRMLFLLIIVAILIPSNIVNEKSRKLVK